LKTYCCGYVTVHRSTDIPHHLVAAPSCRNR